MDRGRTCACESPSDRGGARDRPAGLDKVVELARFATAETEASLIRWAERVSCGAIRRKADLERKRERAETVEAERARSLRWWYEDEGTRFGLEASLPADQGVLVAKALSRLADSMPAMPGEEGPEGVDARRADALVTLCSAKIASDPDPDRATLVVHTSLETLAGAERNAEIEDGPVIAPETARRLACDGRIQIVAEDGHGRPAAPRPAHPGPVGADDPAAPPPRPRVPVPRLREAAIHATPTTSAGGAAAAAPTWTTSYCSVRSTTGSSTRAAGRSRSTSAPTSHGSGRTVRSIGRVRHHPRNCRSRYERCDSRAPSRLRLLASPPEPVRLTGLWRRKLPRRGVRRRVLHPAPRPSAEAAPKRKPAPKKKPERTPTRQILSPHARDAAGIGLVVLALLAVLGVWLEAAGPVGHGLSWLLHGAFGVAAVLFPIVGIYWGFVLLRDVAPEDRVRMFIGFTVMTIGLLGILSLARGNPSPFAGYDATKKLHGLAEAGGLVGALAAYPLSRVLSAIGAGIVCAGLAFLGLLIFTGTPVSSLRGTLKHHLRVPIEEPATAQVLVPEAKPEKEPKPKRRSKVKEALGLGDEPRPIRSSCCPRPTRPSPSPTRRPPSPRRPRSPARSPRRRVPISSRPSICSAPPRRPPPTARTRPR